MAFGLIINISVSYGFGMELTTSRFKNAINEKSSYNRNSWSAR
jgi:hypothetical protein